MMSDPDRDGFLPKVSLLRRCRRKPQLFAAAGVVALVGGVCAASTATAGASVEGRSASGLFLFKDIDVLVGADGQWVVGHDSTSGSSNLRKAAGPGQIRRSHERSQLGQAADQVVAARAVGSLARVYDGKTVETAAAGLADRSTGRTLRAGDQFEIGSNTKTMMATIILQLVAEKRLKLSDSVQTLLPGVVPDGDKITLRMLLQHTSGLYNYTDDPELMKSFFEDPTTRFVPEKLVAGAVKHPALFKPGSQWSYSNTNYLLVGMIMQKTTGQTPERLLQERIVQPLGLSKTSLVTHIAPHTGPGYAHGYLATFTGSSSKPTVDYADVSGWSLSWAGTAGAVVSTAPELSRFISALLGGELLPAQQLAEMLRTVPMEDGDDAGYGLGIARVDTPCGTVWGHTGGTVGHSSHMFATANGKRTVITDTTTVSDEEEPQHPAAAAMAAADENLWLAGLCQMQGKELPTAPAPSTEASTGASQS